jgi:dienelactone hydrolase
VAAALAAAVAAAPRAQAASGPRLTLEPRVALVDAPVAIRLEGLRPGQEVTLRAATTDAEGRPWRSEAVFRAGGNGVVDPAADRPLRGTYAGVDAMGLFWSMQPQHAPAPVRGLVAAPGGTAFPRPASGAIEVRLEARAGQAVLASALAVRRVTGADVKVSEVREQGLVGRLYEPQGRMRPAVLVLGGGSGGIPSRYAPVLAGHGYVALSLAYFGAEGLPGDLVEIPLEYFERAIDWLRARPSVDSDRIAVLGSSRGGEAALLLAATSPELKVVVALAPSHVVWEGALRDPGKTGLDALRTGRSAWTRDGAPLPFVPRTVTPEVAAKVAAGERFHAVEIMQLGSVDLLAVERARIPVEKIGGPVLLVAALSDRTWPAAAMSDRIVEALRARRFPHRVEQLQYEDLAHDVPDAWLPVAHGGTLGGTAPGTMRAFATCWPALVGFLDGSLRATR